jgi:hypothetical protein
MSAAKKRREAVIPRDEDFHRWRKLCEKNVDRKKDFDRYGRKLYGRSSETKRVYMATANQTLHIRSYIKVRPLLEEHRCKNGGNGELPQLEYCRDGQTIRFARDPDISEDAAKEIEEAEAHGDIPGATKFMHAFKSARLFDHSVKQEQVFDGFLPSMLDVVLYGGQSSLIVYGERGSGKNFSLFGSDVDLDYSEHQRYILTEEEEAEMRLAEANRPSTRGSVVSTAIGGNSRPSTANTGMNTNGFVDVDSKDTHNNVPAMENEGIYEEEKDLKWLQIEDEGKETGIMQRTIHYLYDSMNRGKLYQQCRYKIEMQCLASTEGNEVMYDMLNHDSNGKPIECLVHWEPKSEKFEAIGAEFVTYRDRRDMIYAALRSNYLVDYFGMKSCTLIYRFRVYIRGIGDKDWVDMVGDQLAEGQPRTGEFTLIKCHGFEIKNGYPDEHGKDGIFENNETLRLIFETLEKQNYNNLPALRKKVIVPYRNNSVTKLLSPVLKPGSIVVFFGNIGIDKDSHVGTLHTLWAASKVHKPKSHKVQFKRAVNKLKVLNILKEGGSSFSQKTEIEQELHKIQLKTIVEDHKQANLHHILVDTHLHRTGHDGDRTADHTTQLQRAMPRLEKRSANATRTVSIVDKVHVKREKINSQKILTSEEKKRLDDKWDEMNKLENMSAPLFRKTRGPLLKRTGGTVDSKGLLSPMIGIIKFEKTDPKNVLPEII